MKALRETELYDKHFDVSEPEDHTLISINHAVEVLTDLKLECVKRDQMAMGAILALKIQELKQLIS